MLPIPLLKSASYHKLALQLTLTAIKLIVGISFEFGGQTYPNNSVFLMTDIGEDSKALLCVTDHEQCCRSYRVGEWYYPNNTAVSTSGSGFDFYRNRGPQAVRLNRRNNALSPTGRYHCTVPDASGTFQILIAYIIGELLLSKNLHHQ